MSKIDNKEQQNPKPIELRLILNPDDPLYSYVSQLRECLETNKLSSLTRFIIKQAVKQPINIVIPPNTEED